MITRARRREPFVQQQNVCSTVVLGEPKNMSAVTHSTDSFSQKLWEDYQKTGDLHCISVCKFWTCTKITGHRRLMWLSTKRPTYSQDWTLDQSSCLKMYAYCPVTKIWNTYINTARAWTKTMFWSKEVPTPTKKLWNQTMYILYLVLIFTDHFTRTFGLSDWASVGGWYMLPALLMLTQSTHHPCVVYVTSGG